ncbi:MAG: hypothetical protein JNG88_13555 [Phycisphaerales bacterium]|nr:hypothetical protein [Phycisphaerales bacterium]
MKILIACRLPDFAVAELRGLNSSLDYQPTMTADALASSIAGVGILIIDSLRVSPDVIHRGKELELIIRAGQGPGNIALEEASAQGIFVTHCPEKDAVAVAEHVIGLLLALDRRTVEQTIALRSGKWSRSEFLDGRGLAGRTLGMIGAGRAMLELARRASAFGMKVLGWSPSPADSQSAAGVEFCDWPREVARRSDMVAILSPGSLDAISPMEADFFQSLPVGAYVVVAGRNSIIDDAALAAAVRDRRLRVAIDAHSSEPASDSARFRSQLMQIPEVIGTHHTAGVAVHSTDSVAAEIARIVRAFLVSGDVLNCVNLCERSPATWQLLLRVKDQVGVLASILDAIRADGINAEEIGVRVFTGAKAAWISIALDERPSAEALTAIRSIRDVLHLELRAVV